MTILETALELLVTIGRLVGLAAKPQRDRAAERYELLRIQRISTDALARKEIEEG